jgi:HSP20 family protein
MNLVPWRRKREEFGGESANPLAQLRRQMDTLFDRFFDDPWGYSGSELPWGRLLAGPRTDLADSANEVIVTMELPGVDPKEVDIQITGDLLTVRGEKKADKEEKQRDYHYVERQYGSFQRTVQLPSTVDPEKVDAAFKNGVLTITLAKRADAQARKIKVRNA